MAKYTIIGFLLFFALRFTAQSDKFAVSAEKEKMYSPFMWFKYGGDAGLAAFKKSHPEAYQKELWYFCESWYVAKDYVKEGVPLDLYVVDILRFESYRKNDEPYYLVLPGYKDAIVLLPSNKLLYKPE